LSRDREHIIGNQSPKAVIYFVDKDWSLRKDAVNPKIITPNISDVLQLRTSRGTTGDLSSFTIVLSNKDNKYFIKDDIEDEIKQLNLLDSRKTPEIKKKDALYGKIPYPYANAKDFLTTKEITRRHTSKDNPYGESAPEVDISFILQFDSQGNLGYYNIPAKEMEDNELSQINANKYWVSLPEDLQQRLIDEAKPNSNFFTEHGGDLNQGRCVFEPMQRVVIQLSRRFPNGQDELQTVFTGLVSSVTDAYQENLHTITIQGEDLTKWLRITQVNVNPSFIQISNLPDSEDFLLTQHKFANMEGWQIIQTLILGGKSQTQKEFGGVGRYTAVKESFAGPDTPVLGNDLLEDALQEITPVGVPDQRIDFGKSGKEQILKNDKLHLQVYHGVTAKEDDGTRITTPYKLFFRRSANTFDNEYATVWDIVIDVAKLTNFEFYADAYGDLWYHQPRFNNYHILNAIDRGVNPEVHVIRDEDIISHNFTESDENIVTSVFVTGMQDLIEGLSIPFDLANFYEDYSFVRKYGRRFLFTHHPYVRTKQDCWYFAKSLMQRINAERFTGQLTILGRPEIELATPIYVAYRNMIYYVKEISHNFSFGGQFTTTLQLTYGRKPWEILPEVLDYKTIPPQLANKMLEKYSVIEGLPISPELAGGRVVTPPDMSFYVSASDKRVHVYSWDNKLKKEQFVNWVGPGYYLKALNERGIHNALATINGKIVYADLEKRTLVIQGTGDYQLFEVAYVGLGGDTFARIVREFNNCSLAVRNVGSDEVAFNAAMKKMPTVKVGQVIGQLTGGEIKTSYTYLMGGPVMIKKYKDPGYLLYYAVTLDGKSVYPNEVHTVKFLNPAGDIWVD